MENKFIVDQYRQADKEKTLRLARDIFITEKMRKAVLFSENYWDWQYAQSPFGNAIIVLARDRGEVIGQYVNVPVTLKYGAVFLNSTITIDLMVKKMYRRLGLFKQMGDLANTILDESNKAVSLAFPSRNESYAGFIRKLNWIKVGELEFFAKALFYKFPCLGKKNNRVEIKIVTDFPDDVDDLWKNVCAKIAIGIVKNRPYLNWRYSHKPGARYKIVLVYKDGLLSGYFVVSIEKLSVVKLGLIVDMLCIDDPEIMRAGLAKVDELILKEGGFIAGVLKNRLYENALLINGYKKIPHWLNPKNYTLIARINKAVADEDKLKDINNWYLTLGDWDIV